MMLQIKFGCNWPAGLGYIHVWKCGRTDGRTPARVPSYKLTLWAFSSGELIMDQIWPCSKIGQGQPRVIIWTNYDRPESPMLHTERQGHWPFRSGEEDFWRVFTIYMRGGHLGHVTNTPQTNFLPSHWGSIWNLALIGPAVLEKIFENGGRTDRRRQTTMDHGYTISSPMSLMAQVS